MIWQYTIASIVVIKMDAQVHILCSHCEKVLVEVPKEKRKTENVINVEGEDPLSKVIKSDENEASLNFMSESQDEVESSYCEIRIDYSKTENVPSTSKSGGEIQAKLESVETGHRKGSVERKVSGTFKKLEPTIEHIRRIVGYETI